MLLLHWACSEGLVLIQPQADFGATLNSTPALGAKADQCQACHSGSGQGRNHHRIMGL